MALAHSRKLVVGGVQYSWQILGEKDNYRRGWTPGHLRLTLQAETGPVRQFDCESKHWTSEHSQEWTDPGIFTVPAHKVPFGPSQVRQVIEGLPLLNWTVAERV